MAIDAPQLSLRVLPVVDLMGGLVVRGVAGQRTRYRPVESVLTHDASAPSVGAALRRLGFGECYVADLDAIGGAEPAWDRYEQLGQCGLRLWVDAGLADSHRAERLASFAAGGEPIAGIIAGAESLPNPALLADSLATIGPERLAFSLDMKHGRPLTGADGWRDRSAVDIARETIGMGLRRLIVLDLAQVGTGAGPSALVLCRQLRDEYADVEIASGGGVRHVADLTALAGAGCNVALVASALHDGRIGAEELTRFARS